MRKMPEPNIWMLEDLLRFAPTHGTQLSNGLWVPARPLGGCGWPWRLRAAWLVFTGRADAVTWPGQP